MTFTAADRPWLGGGRAPSGRKKCGQDLFLELFEVEINHRRDEKRDELGNDQAADDDQSQRPARSAVGAEAERDRQRAENRGERRHQDRPETVHAGIVNRLFRGFAAGQRDEARNRRS